MTEFGIVMEASPGYTAPLAQEIEAMGFDYLLCPDTQNLSPDPYGQLTLAAAATKSVHLGTGVTNPITREAAVTATAVASLQQESGNRAICAIGRGDSAMRVIGHKPCNLATLEESMGVIKGLAEGDVVEYNGTTQTLPWRHDGSLPVWMAAYGPKALDLCGRKADGFVLQLADPQIAEWTIAAVKRAAADAGRDPESLTITVVAPAYVGDDLAHQRDQVRWFGGMVGNHVADLVGRYGADGSAVPQALTEYIEGRKGYDYTEHGRAGNEHTDFVPDEVIDRFCILGEEDAHIARLRELESLGVDQFAIYLMHDQKDETLDAYGRKIIPALAR